MKSYLWGFLFLLGISNAQRPNTNFDIFGSFVPGQQRQPQQQLLPRGRVEQDEVKTTTPVPILQQINEHNEDGSYSYGYEAADGSFKLETRYPDGRVKGKYGYIDIHTGELKVIEYGADNLGFQPQGDLPEGIVVPPPVPGNDTSDDYSDYQDFDGVDLVLNNEQVRASPRFVVENRARGSIPVQARPPTPSPVQLTTEEPSQNRGQDLRQPVTSRPRGRTPSPPVAARPVEVPRSLAPQPAQPRPNTLDAFSAFQTPFDFPRSTIEEIERRRPGRPQEPAPQVPVAPVPSRARPAVPVQPIEEITTRRPIRIQAEPPQSFIPRQQPQEPQVQSFIPRQLQNRQRERGSSGQRLSQVVVQEVTEAPAPAAPTTQRRPTRPLNFDPRRQRPISQSTVNNEEARPIVPTRATIPVRANNPREDVPAGAPRRIVVNRQRARGRRPVGTSSSVNSVITPRPSIPVTADESFSSFPARGSSRPVASPTPARLAPTPAPTQARPAPTPVRLAPTPARPVAPTPARLAPTPARPVAPTPVSSALAQLEQIAGGQDEPSFTSFPSRGTSRQPSRTTSARPTESQRTIRINPRPTQSSRAASNAASQEPSRARPETPRAILPTQATRVTQPRPEPSRGSSEPTLSSLPAFQSFSANEEGTPTFTSFPASPKPEPVNEPILPTRQPEISRPVAFAPTPVPRRTEVNRAARPSSGESLPSGVPSRFSSFPVQGRPVLPDSPQVPVQVRNPAPVPQREQQPNPISLIPQQRQPVIPFNPQSRPVAQDPRRVNFDALIQEFTGGQRNPKADSSFFNAIPVEQQSSPRQFRPQPAVPSLQGSSGASFDLVTELLS